MLTSDDLARLRAAVSYDPSTGVFTWQAGMRKAGKPAGALNGRGYRYIVVDGKAYRANRLAWLLHYGEWPRDLVDHINGVKDDNRITNLRGATNTENKRNSGPNPRNVLGAKGVIARGKRFRAYIDAHGKIHLGTFDTLEEAVAARAAAELKYHGSFAAMANRPDCLVPLATAKGNDHG